MIVLSDDERLVMEKTRDGWSPTRITRELNIPQASVLIHLANVADKWRAYYSDLIRVQGYANYLRFELLWALVTENLKTNPDPKIFKVAIDVISGQNKMLGIAGVDNEWLTKQPVAADNVEAVARRLGLRIPEQFGLRISDSVTAQPKLP